MLIVISDNQSVSMTGGQDSAAMDIIETICVGLGVDTRHIRVIIPLKKNHEEMVRIFKEEIEFDRITSYNVCYTKLLRTHSCCFSCCKLAILSMIWRT